VRLSLPVPKGGELAAERVLFSLATDYHRQLETYGSLIRQIHHARTSAPALMGWWSWTAYYFELNERAALTNPEAAAVQRRSQLGGDDLVSPRSAPPGAEKSVMNKQSD
jgi:hypothetical protein